MFCVASLALVVGAATAQDREGRIDRKLDRMLAPSKPLVDLGIRPFAELNAEEERKFRAAYGTLIGAMTRLMNASPTQTEFVVRVSNQSWLGQGTLTTTPDIVGMGGRVAYAVAPSVGFEESVLKTAAQLAAKDLSRSGQYSFTLSPVNRGAYGFATTFSKTDPKGAGGVSQKYGFGADYQIGADSDRFIPSISLGYVAKTGRARESSQALTLTDDKSIAGVAFDYTLSATQLYDGTATESVMGFDVTARFSLEFARVAVNYAVPTRSGGEYDYSVTLSRSVGNESSVFFRLGKDNVLTFGFRTPIRFRL